MATKTMKRVAGRAKPARAAAQQLPTTATATGNHVKVVSGPGGVPLFSRIDEIEGDPYGEHRSDSRNTAAQGYRSMPGLTDENMGVIADQLITRTDKIARDWEAKRLREGKKVFICPICKQTGAKVEHFESVGKANKHIRDKHKMVVTQMKLEKVSSEFYTPQPFIIDPPRTMQDILGVEGAAASANLQAGRDAVADILDLQREAMGDVSSTAGELFAIPEHEAVVRVVRLADNLLKKVAYRAYCDGKDVVYRAALAEMNRRGLDVDW